MNIDEVLNRESEITSCLGRSLMKMDYSAYSVKVECTALITIAATHMAGQFGSDASEANAKLIATRVIQALEREFGEGFTGLGKDA